MQISEHTFWRIVNLIAAIVLAGAAIFIGAITSNSATQTLKSALDGAFRRTESTIEGGYTQTRSLMESGFRWTELTIDESTAIVALGSKGDRPAWGNFLRKAKGEAIDRGYVSVIPKGFVTTETGEKRLAVYIQEQIHEVVEKNSDISFEEIAARVVERLGIRRLAILAKSQEVSLNEMIAIVSGFAEKIRS